MTLLTEIWPILAAIVAALGWGFFQRQAGANAERLKQAGRDRAAVEDRLEMHREATADELAAAGKTDEEARQEGLRWSKR
jgi:hypothetical protein